MIHLLHLQEWQQSAVHNDLTRLNIKSLFDTTPHEYLLYSPALPRRNDGRIRDFLLKRYTHLEAGGWWCNGLDPLNNWEPMLWGRFKPDTPRSNWDTKQQHHTDKPVKYESPPNTPNRVTYLRVGLTIWQMVANRYSVSMPENIVISPEGEAIGFWAWVQAHPDEIPIILNEGEKKAGCLLSKGFVAIALPGIWGARVGKPDAEILHPDLVPMAQMGRKFIILFDYEVKSKTRQHVFQATRRTGQALANQGCLCEVAVLPGPDKGVDDWVVSLGEKANQAVSALITDALSRQDYQQSFLATRQRGFRKYKPNLKIETRYISDAFKLPETGLVCIRSDMGTGKTQLLENWRKEHPAERFLNNGHRVNLLKNLAQRLKTEMYSAVKAGDFSRYDALSITIDSLHKMAANLQSYRCLFIDEACQHLAHLLKSKTCKQHRAEILEVLEYLVYQSPLVVLADAHLDDVTVDFFRAMRPAGEQPFIIQNDWKSGERDCFWYEGSNSSALVAAIHAAVMEGKKIIVPSDSKRFIKKLERSLLNTALPSLEDDESQPEAEADRRLRIWAIHSENSGSAENVIFIKEIKTAIKDIDALLFSPSLGTGVDLPDYHFDVIFGAFHAVSQSATECAQMLWRYRPNVPMHIWVAPRPPFGYADCNPNKIKEKILQKNEMTAFLIRIDRETGKRGAEKDWALDASCQIEAQRNWSINNLRADLRVLLEEMGNKIIPLGEKTDEVAKASMKAAGDAQDQEYYQAVSNAKDIDQLQYESRLRRDYLSPEERLECEKFRISDTYGMEVTPELVEKDGGGRLIRQLINLEAILSQPGAPITNSSWPECPTPPSIVAERDLKEREWLAISTDWGNYSTSWLLRHRLRLRVILNYLIQGHEYRGDEPLLLELAERARQFAPHMKAILNLTIPANKSANWILGELLRQLGLSTVSRKQGAKGQQVKFYRLNPEDLEFAQKVLDYRQQKREESERKRKKTLERNARHTAAIQSQYGIQPISTPPLKREIRQTWGGVDTEKNQADLGWCQKIKAYGQLLLEAFDSGFEVMKEILSPWNEEERWEAIAEFGNLAPEKFHSFQSLELNCSELQI